jgi:hypothetical protein
MNAPCLQSKDVNWIEVRPNFHRRNLTFCLGLHNCRHSVGNEKKYGKMTYGGRRWTSIGFFQ